ncbi:MAG: extracellular solute-binding protein [Alphaproteobacteria bacterium]|mgnify:FL=1|jgi:putative spermidine/putrescine transport system substrate-binding protein/spermidine/putrescine transport system substrate-binding protein|nr:extracellular solute-binding protein [Alphaproteobacteria bacterium]MDP6590047.1 extracellular solute-binding protein [Alphaproteobacteria bacterium]
MTMKSLSVKTISLAVAAAVALGGAMTAVAPSQASAGELAILTWEGYADSSITQKFEDETGCAISRTYVGSNDEFPAKLAAGGSIYDAVSPSLDTTGILAKMGVVEPIAIDMLPDWEDIYEGFRAHPSVAGAEGWLPPEGTVWAVPYSWGSIAWMYRSDKFDTPPDSIEIFWDPAYAGKLSIWDDKTNIYAVARYIFGRDVNVYDLSDDQLAQVRDKLIEAKPQMRKYWATAGELVNLYANGEVIFSNTWGGYQSALLIEQGIPMVEFIPKEKADGWQDAWQIVKGTPNMDCAKKFVVYMQSPHAQCQMSAVMGYSMANATAAKECLTPEMYESLHQGDWTYIDGLDFWQEPIRVDAVIETWNAVKAAQ